MKCIYDEWETERLHEAQHMESDHYHVTDEAWEKFEYEQDMYIRARDSIINHNYWSRHRDGH